MIPSAAVRTAGAVRDLSDSSVIVRLTRGRAWIGVLSALLGGIVALNVISLSLNAGSGQISQQISELERSNSALRAEFAERLSAGEVEAAAATLGLATPDPEEIVYLTASDSDADKLARLLRNETVLTDSVAETAPTATGYAETATMTPAAPEVAVQPAPVAPDPGPTSPAPAPTPSGGATSGGVGL